jgi:hypothetical protein
MAKRADWQAWVAQAQGWARQKGAVLQHKLAPVPPRPPAAKPDAAAAVVVHTRTQLAERLANWPVPAGQQAAEISWGLVFCSAIPTAAELAAMRECAKICDRVAAVRLADVQRSAPVVPPQLAVTLRSAGVDVVWLPTELVGPMRVELGVAGIQATLLLQAVSAVLPLLVVVHRADVALLQALRNLQASLGELFTVRVCK